MQQEFKDIQALIAARDFAGARARLKALAPGFRKRARFHLLGARIALAEERTADARAFLDRARALGAGEAALLELEAQLIRATGDLPALLATLEKLAALRPDDARLQARLSRTALAAGDRDRARAAAARAVALAPAATAGHEAAYEAAHSDPQDDSGVIAALRQAIDTCGKVPRFPYILTRFIGFSPEVRMELSGGLVRRWPGVYGAFFPTIDSGRPPRKDPASVVYETTFTKGRAAALRAARAYRARDRKIPSRIPDREMEEVIAALPEPGELQRPIALRETPDLMRSAPTDSGVTVLAFANLQNNFTYDAEVIDALCARRGASAIYLTDHAGEVFLSGVASLGEDRRATLAALRWLLKDMGTQRLIVLGVSGGAFGGLLLGSALGADRYVLSSAATGLTEPLFDEIGDPRARSFLRRMAETYPAADLDLKPLAAELGLGPRIVLAYGADNPVDTGHAQRMQEIEGITLHPIPGWRRHDSITPLLIDGTLDRLLFD